MTAILSHKLEHLPNAQSRRDFLFRSANGFGSLALGWLLSREGNAAENSRLFDVPVNPLGAKAGQLPARAEAVIFMFMVGGPSQVDLFDPKPELEKRHGEPL